jgi:hypothetical protein
MENIEELGYFIHNKHQISVLINGEVKLLTVEDTEKYVIDNLTENGIK